MKASAGASEATLTPRTTGGAGRVHRRQYVVGPEPFSPHPNWVCERLDETTWLSRCPELRTRLVDDRDGRRWALLGLAVDTRPDEATPEERIAATPTAEVPEARHCWAGRWTLLGDGQLHLDATGLLGCYYAHESGRLWASSSPALMSKISGSADTDATAPRELEYAIGIGWLPPPQSQHPNVHRLLASQVLDLRSGVEARRLLPDDDTSLEGPERIEAVRIAMVTTLRRLAALGEPLWLGLSGGHDSRTILALSMQAGIELRAFTRISPRMSVADRQLPEFLAADTGIEHTLFRGSDREASRERIAFEHTAGHVSSGDALPYFRAERAELDGIAIGGQTFEVFSGDHGPLARLAEPGDPEPTALQIARAFREPMPSRACDGLTDWLRWSALHPEPNLDWRERFSLEQETGGWLASKEQLYDLDGVTRFPVFNAGCNYRMLLGPVFGPAPGSSIQLELIRRSFPELLKRPFNPPDLHFGWRGLVRAKGWGLPAYLGMRASQTLRWRWRCA